MHYFSGGKPADCSLTLEALTPKLSILLCWMRKESQNTYGLMLHFGIIPQLLMASM